MNGEKTVALILAAGELTEEWRTVCAEEAVSHRALLQIGNRSMVQIAVDALQNGANVHRLLIAGNLPLPMGCIAVAGGATLLETLLNGVAALSQEETTLLVATADMPFLTADAVREFERKVPSDAGFAYAIVPMERYGEKYPSLRRTTLKLREGVFTGGNLVLLRRDAFVKNREIIEEAYRKRKSIPALAALLGFPNTDAFGDIVCRSVAIVGQPY